MWWCVNIINGCDGLFVGILRHSNSISVHGGDMIYEMRRCDCDDGGAGSVVPFPILDGFGPNKN